MFFVQIYSSSIIFCIKISPAFVLLQGPGASGDVLGAIWSDLGVSWMPLGACWIPFGASWTPLGASWEKAFKGSRFILVKHYSGLVSHSPRF